MDWALTHIEKHGDTDIFPVPFEFQAIRRYWESDVRPWIRSSNLLEWELRPFRRLLTPKHRFGFRLATQLDPIDSIIYTALVYEIGREIEKARIDAAEKIAFSHRFKPNERGRFFSQDYTWDAFQDFCKELSDTGVYSHVLVADIADFYPRIYSHPLQQALVEATTKVNHVRALMRCFNQLSGSVSYGIPVGQAASRLIAELVIDDIDRGLLAEGFKHCRFVDDFRVFCRSEREAFQALAELANLLFENHGLTLQQHKTRVMDVDTFRSDVLKTGQERELGNLSDKFQTIAESIGLGDMYEEIDYDELDDDVREEIDRLNLEDILADHISNSEEIDAALVRFIVGRLAQIGNPNSVELLVDNVDRLYPVFKDIMKYVQTIQVDNDVKHEIGAKLIGLFERSLVGHLEYNRLWILNTFTKDNQWDNEKSFAQLFNDCHDEFSQRKLIMALGRSHQYYWFRSKRRSITEMNPWCRRAFLAAISCLPGDQAEHWYRSVPGLDPLDKLVVKHALENGF